MTRPIEGSVASSPSGMDSGRRGGSRGERPCGGRNPRYDKMRGDRACRRRRPRVPLSAVSPVPGDPPAGVETWLRDAACLRPVCSPMAATPGYRRSSPVRQMVDCRRWGGTSTSGGAKVVERREDARRCGRETRLSALEPGPVVERATGVWRLPRDLGASSIACTSCVNRTDTAGSCRASVRSEPRSSWLSSRGYQ